MSRRDKALKIYEWYQDIRSDTLDWREQRDRCKKAYFGNQWDSKVADRLRSRGQVDVVINGIRTLVRNRVATMIANKPTGKVYGVNKEDIKTAIALQDLCDYIWYNSQGQIRTERIVMSQHREGVGYFVIAPDHKADYGRGELKIYDEIWRHVWIPKTSGREWDFSDAPYMILTKLIDKETFFRNYPNYKGKVDNDFFHDNDEIYWSGQREHEETDEFDIPEQSGEAMFVREFDTYERFYREVPVIYHIPTSTVDIKDDNYTPNDHENQLIKEGIIRFISAPVPRIKYTKTFGNKVLVPIDGKDHDILPIEHYPIVPVVDEDTGNAMPLGEIDLSFGVQELANKAFSTVVLNACLASNPRRFVDAAAAGITDFEAFKEELAAPGAILDMQKDKRTGEFPIQWDKVDGLNPAFYPVFERLLQQLQFNMATFSSKLGDSANAPDTYSATLQYGEWQQDNLRIPLSRLEMGIQRVFDILLQWSPEYYTFPKIFDVAGVAEEPRMQYVNQPSYEGEDLMVLNDISKVKAKFRIRMGSTMPAQSMAYLNLYKELAQTNPIFFKHMVEYLPVKEKEELVKELDLLPKLQEQIQNQQKELQKLTGLTENLLRQQAQGEIQKDVYKTSVDMEKIFNEFQLKLDTILEEQKLEKKKIKSKGSSKNEKAN